MRWILVIPSATFFRASAFVVMRDWFLLCGDESTGKTTLLRLLAGELAAKKGVAVGGVDAVQEPERYSAQVLDGPSLG